MEYIRDIQELCSLEKRKAAFSLLVKLICRIKLYRFASLLPCIFPVHTKEGVAMVLGTHVSVVDVSGVFEAAAAPSIACMTIPSLDRLAMMARYEH